MKVEKGQKFKVVKDVYYVSDGRSIDGEYMTKEELMEQVSHLCVKDDVYEVVGFTRLETEPFPRSQLYINVEPILSGS